jgi:hypothetical protein
MTYLFRFVFIFVFLLTAAFIAASSDAASQPHFLQDTSNQANYLIITHPAFEQELQASFVAWRKSKGYTVRVVTTTAVYREFLDSATATHPQANARALRAFTMYALQHWKRPAISTRFNNTSRPLHVLLVGSADHIPSFRVNVTDPMFVDLRRYEDSIALDEMYVVNPDSRDTRPQAAIGRFPVRTPEHLRTIIAKTRLFEDGLWLRYKQDVVGLTDREDAAWFESNLQFFWQSLRYAHGLALNSRRSSLAGMRPLRLRELNYRLDSPLSAARRDIFRTINDGAMFWLYYGHGAPDVWSSYRIMTTNDVDTAFAPQTLPFVMASVSCRQRFDLQELPSIVEHLVNHAGGAVATFAPSGYGLLSEGGSQLEVLFDRLLRDTTGLETLGTAALQAKLHGMPNDAPDDFFSRRMSLLGDPALKIPVGNLLSVPINDITDLVQPRIAPNPVQAQTMLHYSLPELSSVSVEVLNVLGQRVVALEPGLQTAGEHACTISTEQCASGLYIYRLFIKSQNNAHQTAQGTFRIQR